MSSCQVAPTRASLQTPEAGPFFDHDTVGFLTSLLLHVSLLVGLGLFAFFQNEPPRGTLTLVQAADPQPDEPELQLPEDFFMSDHQPPEVGANSSAEAEMALSAAEVLSELSEVPSPVDLTTVDYARIEINPTIEVATGIRLDKLPVRGAAGEGTTGAIGAIDRITEEIIRSLEERKTLVVWFFDQTASLARQRAEINQRFDRIYHELGVIEAAGNPAFAKHDDKPLLTAVVAFGDQVRFLTDKPTDQLSEIQAAVASIEDDGTGNEHVFQAILTAVDRYKKYRHERPSRNLMFVLFTDEVGDDQDKLDQTVKICRNLEIPVYVVGVPAPFGLDETMLKWVDPDPSYDQTPQWGRVNQGPESLFPERVRLRFASGEDPDPIDSGFGPFALTRLCYETGGIYFAVHPNRNVHREVRRGEVEPFSAHLKYFFDPEVMRKYRPEYVPAREYVRRANENKSRAALLKAAEMSWLSQLDPPQLRFVKRDEAELANELTEAQKAAAKLEPQLAMLHETLKLGEADRQRETSPRWQAGYDLAIGRVLAAKVRAEGYNAMLAEAKRGLKFKDEKNNTWQLQHDREVSTGSALAKAAATAEGYLQRVISEHPGTPWALLAQKELQTPLGWRWTEHFTDLSPPRVAAVDNNNNVPRPARNDTPQMLPPPPPKRPVPKL